MGFFTANLVQAILDKDKEELSRIKKEVVTAAIIVLFAAAIFNLHNSLSGLAI